MGNANKIANNILGGEIMNKGYTNEFDFINYLDNKKFRELNILMQDVIQYLYPDIKPNDIIKATKYGKYAKTDIVVSVRNKKRGLSLKTGHKNSVHIEPIDKFKKYLLLQGVDEESINKLLRYLYSDGTDNNTGTTRISNAEYIDKYPHDIEQLNEIFKNLKSKLISRFLIETDIKYRVKPEVFIHGEVNDFIWASSDEVKSFLEKEKIETTSLHCGKLYIQSWNKNIKRNEKYEYCRNYIQVKWYSLYDDIILMMTRR